MWAVNNEGAIHLGTTCICTGVLTNISFSSLFPVRTKCSYFLNLSHFLYMFEHLFSVFLGGERVVYTLKLITIWLRFR